MKLKKWVITYRIGDGPRREVVVYTATRGAAIESVTEGSEPICARADILSCYGVPR